MSKEELPKHASLLDKGKRLQMGKRRPSPAEIASQIRCLLRNGGTAEHAAGVQWFFKDEIKSHGWYTADLRKSADQTRRNIRDEFGLKFLLQIANRLFVGKNLEEKIYAVFLLEKLTSEFTNAEFELFETWLCRISSWADHDALVHCLIAPMIVANRKRLSAVFRWAKSLNRWHRRAACVSLIRATRERKSFSPVIRLSGLLLQDKDEMVQKGLGWLLRETAKADAKRTVPYLIRIREHAPRLVLRTACETLPPRIRKGILAK